MLDDHQTSLSQVVDLVLLAVVQRYYEPLRHVQNNMHVVVKTRGRIFSLFLPFGQSRTRSGLVLSILLVKRVFHAHANIIVPAAVRPLLCRTDVSRAFIRLIKVETKTAEVIVQMEVELFIEFIFSYRSALDRW